MRIAWVFLAACSYNAPADPSADIDAPLDPLSDAPVVEGIFATDGDTLAIFELDGNVADSSGNGRDATLIGGDFVTTAWGQGLSVPGVADQGFVWTAHANMIRHPYTIEMIVTPHATDCWHKLFGPSDTADTGWNYCGMFQTFPSNMVGPNLVANERHYFAVVSTSASTTNLYVNGTMVGAIDASFSAPPDDAIFFRDDSESLRMETLDGVIDAVRISSKARSATEIAAIQTRLATRP